MPSVSRRRESDDVSAHLEPEAPSVRVVAVDLPFNDLVMFLVKLTFAMWLAQMIVAAIVLIVAVLVAAVVALLGLIATTMLAALGIGGLYMAQPAAEPQVQTTSSPIPATPVAAEPIEAPAAPRPGNVTADDVYYPPEYEVNAEPARVAMSMDDFLADAERQRERERRAAEVIDPPVMTDPVSVPDSAIDAALRSDVGIKKCFFNHQRATGSLPERVVVSFKITPTGSITGGAVTDAALKGTDLDVCMAGALGTIVMPASQNGRAVKYPFQLQQIRL